MASEEKKRRPRRTAEELLAELERKRLEEMEKHRQTLAKIEAEQRRLSNTSAAKKKRMEQQNRFQNALTRLFPDWDYRHFIAAIMDMAEYGPNMDDLAKKGEALLEEHGKPRRGRPARSA